ncbi:MAG: M28 family peptidase [Bacteroidales bacterium]|nr:M28 family peptidase [Bacteroidales bacterium]
MTRKILILLTLALAPSLLGAQGAVKPPYDTFNSKAIHAFVQPSSLMEDVRFLSDSLCSGRASSTIGGMEAAFWISDRMEKVGLKKMGPSYIKSFRLPDGNAGHNVIGMLPGSGKFSRDSYIIVGAHFDGLGIRGGRMYPCADCNAAGVASMLNIAEMFRMWTTIGHSMGASIIFVAFDAKELSMAGSKAVMEDIASGCLSDPVSGRTVTRQKIRLMVNLDQMGTTMEPITRDRPDYLIMLGNDKLPKDKRQVLRTCNLYTDDCSLDLGFDYYGSENFTRLFYRLSDQKPFADAGIPAVFFTSGITGNTNKVTDTAETIDYDVLRRRIILIWHFVERLNR